VRSIEDERTRRAAVTVDHWSGAIEGTYDDGTTPPAPPPEADDEPAAPPAVESDPAGTTRSVRLVRRSTLPRRRPAERLGSARGRSVRQVRGRAAPAAAGSVVPGDAVAPQVSLVRRVSLTRPPGQVKRRRVSLRKAPTQQRGRWLAFAPQPPRPPALWRRVLAAIGRPLIHEFTLASLGSLLLAIVMTWPTMRHPNRTVPQDLGDPLLQAWQLAWSGHALKTGPGDLWHSNTFYPERYSYAFSDTLLGYAPFGLLGNGFQAAILRYNIVFVLAFALAFLGTYALVRQLGGARAGAVVAAAAFAYAPWRWGQAGHLHVLSSGGIVLALAMLARGHGFSLRDGYRSERVRPGWAVAGWAVAAWQISLGFGIGLPFAYALALLVVAAVVAWFVAPLPAVPASWLRSQPGAWVRAWWVARPKVSPWLLGANVAGGLLFAGAALAMAYPYLRVVEQHPYARRGVNELDLYSPPAHGFLTAPAESWLWGSEHSGLRTSIPAPNEGSLLLGYAVIGLALAGLLYSVWPYYVRFVLLLGMFGSVVLAMGTSAPLEGKLSYLVLHRFLPGWDAIRTPGRLVLWTTLLAGILAAGAVSAFVERVREFTAERVPARPGPMLQLAIVLPLALVLVEGISASPHPEVPPAPAALRQAEAPLLVLPTDQLSDEMAMAWSTAGFPRIVNGGSAFTPQRLREVREILVNFPDAASIRLLRDLGVRSVVVVKSRVAGTPFAAAVDVDVTGLGIEREDTDDAVIFRIGTDPFSA
jgi:hypothetical protein